MMSSTDILPLLKQCPTIPLRDGTPHPLIGYGTYKVGAIPSSSSSCQRSENVAPSRSTYDCITDALSLGYRMFDCAQFYENEADIGRALHDSKIPRKDLFLISKVWTTTIEQGPDAIRTQFQQTLHDLQTDYLDVYLIHWPVPQHHMDAYRTLLRLKQEGTIKTIGVSNYAIEDYLELKEGGIAEEDLPAINQLELNPFLVRKQTVDFFLKEKVVLQAYRPLRDGKGFDHPTLVAIAKWKNLTVAQLLGRWCLQHNFIYLPKTTSRTRMVENASLLFRLTQEEMEIMDNDLMDKEKALEVFLGQYRKGVNRGTTHDGTLEGVKMQITVD